MTLGKKNSSTKKYAVFFVVLLGVCLCNASIVFAQAPEHDTAANLPDAPDFASQQQPAPQPATASNGDGSGKQTKRILGIVPNFRSVSANTKLPPMSVKDKFVGAAEDSFDYSALIFAGGLAGVSMAENSYPEFHQGAAGYARYYWHTYADQTDENFLVEFFLPAALHQDPRYYTKGSGGFVKRAGYSFSRVLITRTDGGNETFNTSEIVGAGAASGISSLYYPTIDRTWTKVGQRWLTNVVLDGGTFMFKEFWPDINDHVFHQKD
ncbi:hypothetical protein [Silvibacterium acidisoli]|uniref:hypothetical protein n=1 Tax=Acidobacteriaceae bacterium ZG23-2 TaxID=2883246 RepID=UPI00406D3D80